MLTPADNQLTNNWLKRLRVTAHTNEAREQQAQLQAVLDYFNQEAYGKDQLAAIDWDGFRANIHTPQVVDKIQAKYADFMGAQFQVDGAVAKCGTRSAAMKALDVSMHYNFALWSVHYQIHLDQLETLHNVGDPTEIGRMEMGELFPEVNAYSAIQQEVGNIAPQDLVEDSVAVRVGTQFSWGSRYCPPFVHSNDSMSAVVATLAKLGK